MSLDTTHCCSLSRLQSFSAYRSSWTIETKVLSTVLTLEIIIFYCTKWGKIYNISKVLSRWFSCSLLSCFWFKSIFVLLLTLSSVPERNEPGHCCLDIHFEVKLLWCFSWLPSEFLGTLFWDKILLFLNSDSVDGGVVEFCLTIQQLIFCPG